MSKMSFAIPRLFKRRERLYIMPTKVGLLFFLFILAVLLMSAIYSVQGIQLLGFFMLGLFALALTWTHSELRGLSIQSLSMTDASSGSKARTEVRIESRQDAERVGVRIAGRLKNSVTGDFWRPEFRLGEVRGKIETVRGFDLPLEAPRGKWQSERWTISSRSPFGLFQVWMVLPFKPEVWIYPVPIVPPLYRRVGFDQNQHQRAIGEEDFAGVRESHWVTSASRVVAKPAREESMLLVKDLEANEGGDAFLDWNALQGDHERKLSYCAGALMIGVGRCILVTPDFTGVVETDAQKVRALRAWAESAGTSK